MEHKPEIIYDHGIHILGTILWMDPTRGRDLAFLSHFGRLCSSLYRKVICTGETAAIATKGGRGRQVFSPLTSPYGRPFSIGQLRINLYNAGFAPGSAQILVDTGKGKVLYSGDLGFSGNVGVLPPESVDILIVSAPLAHPDISVPPLSQMQEATVSFVRSCLREMFSPVIACPTLGTAQDVITLLHENGLQVCAHPNIEITNSVLRSFGYEIPDCPRFNPNTKAPHAIVWPLHLLRSPILARLEKVRTLALTGAAAVRKLSRNIEADMALPWTRHPSFEQTLQFVRDVGAETVYTVYGFEKEFAEVLVDAGFDARDLTAGRQLHLDL